MYRLYFIAALLTFSLATPVLAQDNTQPAPAAAGPDAAGPGPGPDMAPMSPDGPPPDAAAAPDQQAAAPKPPAAITDEAQRIWDKYGDAIYQVQTIDLKSESKNSIGSGFQFSKDGLIATNYHVVAEVLQHPENNRLEYLHDKGEKGDLKVLIADVGHDLAILKMDKPGKDYLDLGGSDLPKGTKLFSLGNPHDIGFTIIEGTYNGVSKESFIDKIHFSGSLNPGMSGGPALSHDGRVVGVNVLTAGNQISFLVPVEPLKALVAEQAAQKPDYDFVANAHKHIEEQLLKAQQKVADQLLGKEPWKTAAFGDFTVPARINPAFKCWGDTTRQEKMPYSEYSRSSCSSQDRLFLDEGFDTGTLAYNFANIVAAEKLNPLRFYNYYQGQFQAHFGFGAREEDVTNYDCNTKFVDAADHRWKSSFCVRQYKKYPRVYDMQLFMAQVDNPKEGMLVSLSAQGISKENSLKLAERFLSEIHAKPPASASANPPPPPPAEATPKPVSAKQPDEVKP